MKKIILNLFIWIFLISLTSASISNLGTFKIGEEVDLTQICASCTFNNITSVIFPSSRKLLGNFEMTKVGSEYNFTLSSGNITTTGEYIVNGIGDLDGTNTVWNYNFFITETGTVLKTPNSITYLILFLGALFFFLLCLYGGIALPFKNKRDDEGRIIAVQKLKYFKVGLLFLSYTLFVWLANLLFALANNFSIIKPYTAFFEMSFTIMIAFSFPLFVFMLIIMSILAWKDLQLKKLLLRGVNPK